MSYYAEGPGLFTDLINPFPFVGVTWPYLVEKGFEWASFQVYNPNLSTSVKVFDLAAVRAHGFQNIGVWGVIYTRGDFYNGGKQIGMQAKKLGANHCIIDAEECLKNTRGNREAIEIIRGVRDGGWTGPVDLSTLGAPWTPTVNDYAMDLVSFLETGGSIHSQDYLNESEGYDPKYAVIYYKRLGVPEKRINHTIAFYSGARGRVTGNEWVRILRYAGVRRNFSVYMVQDATQADYLYLAQLTQEIVTKPMDAASTRQAMIALAEDWLASQPPLQTYSRIRLAKRILQTTDLQLQKVRLAIFDALNGAGVGQ